jgi:hypothetical protein
MNLYQLHHKESDVSFINYQVVKCDSVISVAALSSIKPGDKIVVQLHGSKYMGRVHAVQFTHDNQVPGYFEVIRQR